MTHQLEDLPHALNVVLGMTPVPEGVKVAQLKVVQLPKADLGHRAGDLPVKVYSKLDFITTLTSFALIIKSH